VTTKMKTCLAVVAAWVAACCVLHGSLAAPTEDRVASLPGFGAPVAPLYSGYLSASPSQHVHYLLEESESEDGAGGQRDPLILWLQGGPGASSLMGAFQEFGTYILNSDTTVVRNPFAWSRYANLLFLESPVGVGFSYCQENLDGGKCSMNDTSTAELNLQSLIQFVQKFPEYEGRDFMIWGESYAGVYVPTLANLIYETSPDDLPLNFLGFAVGDPCTDEQFQHLSDQLHFNLRFAYQNGFISQAQYAFLRSTCVKLDPNNHLNPDTSTTPCRTAWRTYWIATANNDGQNVDGKEAVFGKTGKKFINTFNDYGPDGGPYTTMLRNYLSSAAVKDALHVSAAPVGRWGMGNGLVYTKEHLACFYEETVPPTDKPKYDYGMLPFYTKLAGKVRNIVVFNGDTDPDVQYRGTESCIEFLDLPIAKGGEWRPWFFDASPVSGQFWEQKPSYWGELLASAPLSPQLGGYVKNYEGNVSFVTVHTSGHMVPQFRPAAALQLFRTTLNNMLLSPPLDVDKVETCSDDEFFGTAEGGPGYMGKWIADAQAQAKASSSRPTKTGTVHK